MNILGILKHIKLNENIQSLIIKDCGLFVADNLSHNDKLSLNTQISLAKINYYNVGYNLVRNETIRDEAIIQLIDTHKYNINIMSCITLRESLSKDVCIALLKCDKLVLMRKLSLVTRLHPDIQIMLAKEGDYITRRYLGANRHTCEAALELLKSII